MGDEVKTWSYMNKVAVRCEEHWSHGVEKRKLLTSVLTSAAIGARWLRLMLCGGRDGGPIE